jgi:hypothetical protein
MHRRLRLPTAIAALAALLLGGCGARPTSSSASVTPPPLPPLAALVQGPGARWSLHLRPPKLLDGPFAPLARAVFDPAALARFSRHWGVDLTHVEEAFVVTYGAVSLYAARIPPAEAELRAPIEAFDHYALPPVTHTPLGPHIALAEGNAAAGGTAAVATIAGRDGGVVLAELGRHGPVRVGALLAQGRLGRARALDRSAPFDALYAEVADAPLALMARCPLDVLLGDAQPEGSAVVLQECEGASLQLRARDAESALIELRLHGAWGKDAALARDDVEKRIAAILASRDGRLLGLRDAAAPNVTADEKVVTATLVVPVARLAEAFARLAGSAAPTAGAP